MRKSRGGRTHHDQVIKYEMIRGGMTTTRVNGRLGVGFTDYWPMKTLQAFISTFRTCRMVKCPLGGGGGKWQMVEGAIIITQGKLLSVLTINHS